MDLIRAGLLVGVVVISGFPTSAWSTPPTVTDFATCNAEAENKTPPPSALPRDVVPRIGAEDAARPRATAPAPTARPTAAPSAEPTDPSGSIVSGASNPQHEGMSAARADDPEYRAAYQSCMRRRGF